jgi:NAD(P)-dependent dehydrogenase (short-subunit alcohol dehydrogenase family)
MAIYRANPTHGAVWLTGGSTGIGRALALDLARDGYTVAVTTRKEDPIDATIEAAVGLAGKILPFYCDVTDEAGMARTAKAIEETAGPIVLAVFNAGVYRPVHAEALDLSAFRQSYDVNFFGVLHGLVPVVAAMQKRGRGHIVVMGSVSSYFGWPTTSAYGGTKAALNVLAEALRYDFAKMNIRIQIMNPGFIDTPMAAKSDFEMPGLMPVDKAAARILRAIRSGGFETTFPRRQTWGLKLLRLMPRAFVFKLVNEVTAWRARPLMPGNRKASSESAAEPSARSALETKD